MKGSLRARLFAGAFVWMIAVFVVVTALLLKLTRNHPELGIHGPTYHVLMGIFAIAFVVGGLFLVDRAVAPFRSLRARLSRVREGQSQRVEGAYPSEVQPLVNDLNGLLKDRDRAIARALATAGDLAHGLKTPLAVLAQEAEQAGATGHPELATTLGQLVERMERQIDYHLARARATASAGTAPGLRCPVLPSVEGLVRTMRRLYAGRELKIDTEVSPAHEIRGRREDLDEMLGTCSTTPASGRAPESRFRPPSAMTPGSSSRWTTTGQASIRLCARRCCSEECGPTSRSGDPGSASRSSAISPSSTGVP